MRAIEYTNKNSSLTWFDHLWCRALKGYKGENRMSLESGDMEYLLKLNEYLDVEDFVTDVHERDMEAAAKAEQAANKGKKGRRG